MAGKMKNTKKNEKKEPTEKNGKLLNLLALTSSILCFSAFVLLIVGVYGHDFGDYSTIIHNNVKLVLVVATLTGIGSIATISKANSLGKALCEQKLNTVLAQVNEKSLLVDENITKFLGQNYLQIKEEYETLQKELLEIKETQQKNIVSEIENLKIENADLRDRLSHKNLESNRSLETEEKLQVA